jgi:hypothetical protein
MTPAQSAAVRPSCRIKRLILLYSLPYIGETLQQFKNIETLCNKVWRGRRDALPRPSRIPMHELRPFTLQIASKPGEVRHGLIFALVGSSFVLAGNQADVEAATLQSYENAWSEHDPRAIASFYYELLAADTECTVAPGIAAKLEDSPTRMGAAWSVGGRWRFRWGFRAVNKNGAGPTGPVITYAFATFDLILERAEVGNPDEIHRIVG